MALVLGLLFSVNLSKNGSVKSKDMTKAQVGWGISTYVSNFESDGLAHGVTVTGWTAIGAYGGTKVGVAIGAVGGSAGMVAGAIVGGL